VHKVHDGVTGGHGKFRPRVAPNLDLTSGFAGTRTERLLVGALTGPTLGLAPHQVPDVATLLFGPLARGSKVSLR
jgi:hypothetical protein